ncbi:presenilin-associated rhomboid-like protein, mitochondrial isoform X2 [Artemia franciscana]|uniref:presenilin-associated rhomboid-like protein, mitochondrial isoform X2 n=1 Tax=Artemia franciscana TaxID=6661 RepID=UPI0032DAD44C
MSILASQWHRCRTILTQVPVRSIRIQPRPGGKTNGFHPRKVIQEMSVSPEKNQVLKPFLFTVGVCTTSYIGATLWQYEDLRSSGKLIFQANRESLAEWIGRQKRGRFREEVHQWWNSVPANEKVFYPILFLNAVVFLAWKVKRWHIPMTEWFCANPVGRAVCWPLFLSTFSHYSLLHLGLNMYCLRSFTYPAVHSLGQEQFLGLYISGGVVASFMSHLHKVATNQKVLSLGASGAILSIFAFMCCQMPNSKLELVFLPGFSFTAQTPWKAGLNHAFHTAYCLKYGESAECPEQSVGNFSGKHLSNLHLLFGAPMLQSPST